MIFFRYGYLVLPYVEKVIATEKAKKAWAADGRRWTPIRNTQKSFISVHLCPSAAKVCRIVSGGQGAVAQLGERLICIQEVAGSIPTSSTSLS